MSDVYTWVTAGDSDSDGNRHLATPETGAAGIYWQAVCGVTFRQLAFGPRIPARCMPCALEAAGPSQPVPSTAELS